MKNKRAMIGNLVMGILVIFVGLSLMGPISDQIQKSALNKSCITIEGSVIPEAPQGPTDSFGGAGVQSFHFGGYDGIVVHKDFYGLGKTTSYDCTNSTMTMGAQALISFAPIFFVLAILLAAMSIITNSLKGAGFL